MGCASPTFLPLITTFITSPNLLSLTIPNLSLHPHLRLNPSPTNLHPPPRPHRRLLTHPPHPRSLRLRPRSPNFRLVPPPRQTCAIRN